MELLPPSSQMENIFQHCGKKGNKNKSQKSASSHILSIALWESPPSYFTYLRGLCFPFLCFFFFISGKKGKKSLFVQASIHCATLKQASKQILNKYILNFDFFRAPLRHWISISLLFIPDKISGTTQELYTFGREVMRSKSGVVSATATTRKHDSLFHDFFLLHIPATNHDSHLGTVREMCVHFVLLISRRKCYCCTWDLPGRLSFYSLCF